MEPVFKIFPPATELVKRGINSARVARKYSGRRAVTPLLDTGSGLCLSAVYVAAWAVAPAIHTHLLRRQT
jgi:hypothetical protein